MNIAAKFLKIIIDMQPIIATTTMVLTISAFEKTTTKIAAKIIKIITIAATINFDVILTIREIV